MLGVLSMLFFGFLLPLVASYWMEHNTKARFLREHHGKRLRVRLPLLAYAFRARLAACIADGGGASMLRSSGGGGGTSSGGGSGGGGGLQAHDLLPSSLTAASLMLPVLIALAVSMWFLSEFIVWAQVASCRPVGASLLS